jgi:hypothetical protein
MILVPACAVTLTSLESNYELLEENTTRFSRWVIIKRELIKIGLSVYDNQFRRIPALKKRAGALQSLVRNVCLAGVESRGSVGGSRYSIEVRDLRG